MKTKYTEVVQSFKLLPTPHGMSLDPQLLFETLAYIYNWQNANSLVCCVSLDARPLKIGEFS